VVRVVVVVVVMAVEVVEAGVVRAGVGLAEAGREDEQVRMDAHKVDQLDQPTEHGQLDVLAL
jgi:hypothetical protein